MIYSKVWWPFSFSLKITVFFVFCLPILSSGCVSSGNNGSGKNIDNGNLVTIAEKFTLEKGDLFTKLKIKDPWQGANNVTQVYYLVKRGDKIPDGSDSSGVIFVPVRKIICTSTTHAAMIKALGEENSISGMSGANYLYDKALRDQAEKGFIKEVGYDSNMNKELLVRIKPDLVMVYGVGGESSAYVGKLKELGIKVLFNADYLEIYPLRKAEWIKLFGALYCKERIADSLFESEVTSYNNIRDLIRTKTTDRPKVLLGLPFRDSWYISPGNSFISNLIADAGGTYLWEKETSSVSMPFGIESVFIKGQEAQYWLNTGTASDKKDILALEPRLSELNCFKTGNLFNNNLRLSHDGGNDYWESGSVYPHLVLADIASILHPGVLANHELYFYRKLN